MSLEALARVGIGSFILVDNDKICETNINRQILATNRTIGRLKVEVGKERILDINPKANVETYAEFFLPKSEGILANDIKLCSRCSRHYNSKNRISS